MDSSLNGSNRQPDGRGKKRCGWRLPGGRGTCKKLVPDGKHSYCQEHQKEYLAGFQKRGAAKRSPGGLYSTARWKQLRGAHLAENPLCKICGRPGNVVDHLQPHRGDPTIFYDSDNLITLCKAHHDEMTQLEIKWRGWGLSGSQIRLQKLKLLR